MEDISIPNFDPVSILVYGDVMLDRYWYGDTSRISPEAPVPVVNIQTHDNKAGGAANVALNIEAIGGQSLLMGVIGDDPESHLLKEALEATRIETHLRCLPGYRT
ncbi:MAG TPA: PfkB family carbohydrate kinase, partial [Coxiellaceae bacterium]|nr:PfkB family carbohydrate kinase [Coxiellaceae bacterium]